MANVRLHGTRKVVITGFGENPDMKELRRRAVEAAKSLQLKIAVTFEQAMTYAGALKKNDPDYTLRKVLSGMDPRRGHFTGRLQRALYRIRLWRISVSRKRVTIEFRDSGLHSAIPYAVYFQRLKARGGRIVGVKRSWLSIVRAVFAGVKPERAKRVRPTKKLGQILRVITTEHEKLKTEVKIGVQ